MSVTSEEVRKNILTCFGDDFRSRHLDRYVEIGVFLGNGEDERMNAALTALNKRILVEMQKQRDFERIMEYLEARLAFYRRLNKGADRDASVDPRRLESYRDLKESKPPSARGLFGAALREIERDGGFEHPDKEPLYVGFVPGSEFLDYLKQGYAFKDLGAGLDHGEFTHRLQWCLLIVGGIVDPVTDTAKLYREVGELGYGAEFRDNRRALWDVLFDRETGTGALAFTRVAGPDDFRRPENLTAALRRKRNQLEPLALIIESLVEKRTYLLGPEADDRHLADYVARKLAASRYVEEVEVRAAQQYLKALAYADPVNANVSGAIAYRGGDPRAPAGYVPPTRRDSDSIEMTRAPAAPAAAPARTVKCRCYITTAVCEALGLPDDCETLALLRAFRDTVLARTEEGRQEIAQYYTTAPAIVAAIDARPAAERVYRALMETVIAPAAADILAGRHDEARHRYRRMVEQLAGSAHPWSALDGS